MEKLKWKLREQLKENVIVGHKIPAGTGLRTYNGIRVASKGMTEKLAAELEANVERKKAQHVQPRLIQIILRVIRL